MENNTMKLIIFYFISLSFSIILYIGMYTECPRKIVRKFDQISGIKIKQLDQVLRVPFFIFTHMQNQFIIFFCSNFNNVQITKTESISIVQTRCLL